MLSSYANRTISNSLKVKAVILIMQDAFQQCSLTYGVSKCDVVHNQVAAGNGEQCWPYSSGLPIASTSGTVSGQGEGWE